MTADFPFAGLFRTVVRYRRAVIALYIAVICLCAYLSGFVNIDSDLSHYLPADAESTIDLHIMEETFDAQIPNAQLMVTDISVKDAESLTERISDIDGVTEVSWISDLNAMNTPLSFFPGENHLIGNSVSVYDLKKVISADNIRINLITGTAIFLVLILTFRSLLLPMILTLCIEGSAWITMASFLPEGRPIFYIGYLVVTSILLGCTVDYAILVTSRYRELAAGNDPHPVGRSIELSASSVLTSGLILTSAGIGLSLISTNQLVAQLGIMLARGTMTAAAAVLFALPGMLSFYHRIKKRQRSE